MALWGAGAGAIPGPLPCAVVLAAPGGPHVVLPEFAAFCAAKTDAVEVKVDGAEGVEERDVVEVGGESSSSSEL